MDGALWTLLMIVAGLILLDVTALRYGAISRRSDDDRPDWW